MKLTLLTQYFPPEIGAPQARLSELAGYFVEAGHEVSVLTAMPSYPMGRVFDGYGGLVKREDWRGVNVVRSFIVPSQSAALVPRLTNYLSFAATSAVTGTFALRRADFLLTESPPLFLGATGIYLSRLKRARLIFNVSDLWPDGAVRIGVIRAGSVPHRLAEQLEALCYRAAWLVTGQSRTILESVEERFPGVRTYHLSNGCDTRRYGLHKATPEARARLGPQDKFVVLYAGLHGIPQGLDQILDVAERCKHDDRLRFVLIGDGPVKSSLIERAGRTGLDNVSFLDSVPSAELPPLLASADALLITLGFDLPGAVPSKIYESMASERPLILVAVGEAAEIVKRHDAGIVVAPRRIDELAEALLRLVESREASRAMAARAKAAAVKHFDRGAIAARFIEFLEGNLP
jgi:colanic acid biosynthesis glycosyl transferase WcaI